MVADPCPGRHPPACLASSLTTVANRDEQIAEYVAEHAPELDPQEVRKFIDAHEKPADVRVSHVAWAVGVLRERGEGEAGDGLGVDAVVDEIRRQDR